MMNVVFWFVGCKDDLRVAQATDAWPLEILFFPLTGH